MAQTLDHDYEIGQPVVVDSKPELGARVIAIRFFSEWQPEYLVAWWYSGEMKSDWFAAWRLSDVG